MNNIASSVDVSAQAQQRKMEKLFSKVFIVGGAGTAIASLFDSNSGLFTPWDNFCTPITSALYFISGLLIYFRPQWITLAVLLSLIPSAIYQQGVLYMVMHHPSAASYYSAASSGSFFPLIYVVLFIVLPKGAAKLSWIHCAGFYLQFLLNHFWFSDSQSVEGEHLLVEVMMSHPVYIVALSYIIRLRERLHATQQEAHQNKEEFLAMLSHEIRNLLQTMVGAIDLLNLKLKDATERRNIVRLQNAASQLQIYLQDINELTRLEDPALSVKKSPFNLTQLLHDMRDEWLPQAENQGLQFTLQLPATHTGAAWMMNTDEARLRQIISNLISNALKYTQAGSVTLAARVDSEMPHSVTITVSDTGIGMDEKYLDKIFKPYVRLENAKQSRAEGSGLGLSIVQRLVSSIGGTMRVESQLNVGSRFQITVLGIV
ncbi:MAG: HAMP domain-containing histidine kinase [Sideroxydans sp.]|nr:HAMP domain-containing histidine kinase [Sideroxydans sp.]